MKIWRPAEVSGFNPMLRGGLEWMGKGPVAGQPTFEPASAEQPVNVQLPGDATKGADLPTRGVPLLLTVVVPVFNEEASLPFFHRRLLEALAQTHATFEILYVDDGSSDASPVLLRDFQERGESTSVVRLSRNFGKEAAMSAGLRLARGDAVVLIDADLQDPPELIGAMLDKYVCGADVVNMHRQQRDGESLLKIWTSKAFYWVMHRLSEVPIPADVGDFRLLSRRVVNALNQLPERGRFMKGLFAWVGLKQVSIDYCRAPRIGGRTKWPYLKLWNLALDGITGFSLAPLKLASYAGMLSAFAAFSYALYFLFKTLALGDAVHGFPTLIVVILMLGGLQLMAIGLVGEYLGRLYVEAKGRPLYLIDFYRPAAATLGVDEDVR